MNDMLSDREIVALLVTKELVSDGLKAPYSSLPATSETWYSRDSPVQPASLDLHIGQIYIPGVKETEAGGSSSPIKKYSLEAGATAVVSTSENLKIPKNIAAFGFPPDSVSAQGILMTNPGHIDPGYEGRIKFTLINMGKKAFPLKIGDMIATLIFVKVEGINRDYKERRKTSQQNVQELANKVDENIKEMLANLSADFLDVNKRAEAIVERRVWQVTLGGGLIVALASVLIPFIGSKFGETEEKEKEKRINAIETKHELLESRLESIGSISGLNSKIFVLTTKLDSLLKVNENLLNRKANNQRKGP